MLLPLASSALALTVSLSHVSAAHAGPRWTWPLLGPHRITRSYDPPAHRWEAGHRGVDLAPGAWRTVLAVSDGTVSWVGLVAGVSVVSIDVGDVRATYQPVTTQLHAGDVVHAGERIGSLTLIGSHCAPEACLHLGVVDADDDYRDPMRYLARLVRLLPLR